MPIRTCLRFALPFIVITLLLAPQPPRAAEMVDRVVAVVNDEVITLSELDEEASGLFAKLAATVPSELLSSEMAKARDDILTTMIDKKLIAQKAKEKNISVSKEEIDQAFARVLERSGMSREMLLETLLENGLNEAVYRTTLESQLLQNKLVSTDVQQKVVVTEAMILDYYDINYTSKVDAGSYYLLQMGFGWQAPDSDSANPALAKDRDEAKMRAERVHSLATAGQDFRNLAKKFSDLPSAADGGDIGTFLPDEMADDMKEAVTGLKAGEISDIIETTSGFQFFKLLSVGEGSIVRKESYESVKEEIRQSLYEQKMQEAYKEWVNTLKEKAYIRKM